MMRGVPSDPTPRRDPVDPNKSNMLPYGRNAGQSLPSTQASATQILRGGMVQTLRHSRNKR